MPTQSRGHGTPGGVARKRTRSETWVYLLAESGEDGLPFLAESKRRPEGFERVWLGEERGADSPRHRNTRESPGHRRCRQAFEFGRTFTANARPARLRQFGPL